MNILEARRLVAASRAGARHARAALASAALAALLSSCGGGASSAPPADDDVVIPPAPASALFAQGAGFHDTLLVTGQQRDAIAAYAQAMGAPAGAMFYTDLAGQGGLQSALGGGGGCGDAGVQDLPSFLAAASPHAVIQLGLALTGGEMTQLAGGQLDAAARRLAETLRATGHPVLLRIGYEAEGPWNAYSAPTYARGFRRLVAILRGASVGGQAIAAVPNVATVWHLAASSQAMPDYGSASLSPWYPGDDAVDWVGVSWFGEGGIAGLESADARARDGVAAFALAHAKPLMIAESAPRDWRPSGNADPDPPDAATSWQSWYAPVLAWAAAHDVRVWSYIDQDWHAFPMFAGSCGNGGDIWGDSRVEQPGSTVRAAWAAQLQPGAPVRRLRVDEPSTWCDAGVACQASAGMPKQ